MIQKSTLWIAAGLTAFMLVLGGALAGWFAIPPAQAAPPAPTLEMMQAREAAYQELIRQANERLQQAYASQQQAANTASQPVQSQSPAPAQPENSSLTGISPQQAAALALQAVPGAALQRPPELVNFQGMAAYEVTLSQGRVYIDASTGALIYNDTAPRPNQIASRRSDDSEHDND